MKKFLLKFLLILISSLSFAQGYKITNVNYILNDSSWSFLPTTKEYALEQKVSLKKDKIFETKEDLYEYIDDYKIRLQNTRAFESIEVTVDIKQLNKEENYYPVELNVKTIDSIHVLAVPYPKYDSNNGFIFKLKIKDTNFLGTLNTMSSDINFQIDTSESNTQYIFGCTFSFDYPFKAGIFNATWVNDYNLNFTIGNSLPEWNTKTGLKFVLPKNNISYCFQVYQKFVNNLDYIDYNDNFYFNNELIFSTPISIYETKNYGTLSYSPSLSYSVNYDKDGIHQLNTDLKSPVLTFSHSLSIGRVNWNKNLRDGINASLTNSYSYNFKKEHFTPSLSLETQLYKSFIFSEERDYLNIIGINLNFYTAFSFVKFDNPYFSGDGSSFGGKLRGIRDSQYCNGWDSLLSPGVITLNLDFPFHLFTTHFKSKFMNYFNCDCQISPFIDIGLSYNKFNKTWFNPKDGYYSAGIEVLVYPAKWSSFTVRGSIGIDIGRKLFSNFINTTGRDMGASSYEILIGIGLHY